MTLTADKFIEIEDEDDFLVVLPLDILEALDEFKSLIKRNQDYREGERCHTEEYVFWAINECFPAFKDKIMKPKGPHL